MAYIFMAQVAQTAAYIVMAYIVAAQVATDSRLGRAGLSGPGDVLGHGGRWRYGPDRISDHANPKMRGHQFRRGGLVGTVLQDWRTSQQ